jgi:iron complex outermembrane recepter protein
MLEISISTRFRPSPQSHRHAGALLTAALLCAMASGPVLAATTASADSADAAAATGSTTLQEVIVTAEKRQQSEQVVPVSIEALTGKQLAAQVVLNVQDLMEHVTGLVVAPDSQGDAPTFAIRSSKQDNGTTGGVAVYLDNMPLTSNYSVANANYDIASVDVLKGPQGTLFGASATGGAIVFRTNQPTKQFDAWVSAEGGDYGRQEYTGMVNVPVSDALQVRLAADYVDRPDGFVKNLVPAPGEPANLSTDLHDSARLSVRLTTGAVINDLVADYYHENDMPTQSVLTQLLPSITALGVPLLNGYNQVAIGGNASGINLPLFQRITSGGAQDTLTWPINSNFTFVNTLGYRDDSQDTFQSSSSEVIDLVNGRTTIVDVSGVEEATLHFTSDDERVRNTTGLFLNEHRQGTNNSYDLAQNYTYDLDLPAGLFGPGSPAIVSPLSELSNSRYNRKLHSLAPYSQTEIKLTSELTAIVGVRYNWDGGSFNDQQRGGTPPEYFFEPEASGNPYFGPCSPSTATYAPRYDSASCIASNSASFKAPSWNFALQDQFASHSMIYFRVAHGYIAGGFNDEISDPRYQIFQPEKTTEFETGIKSDWDLAGRPVRTNFDLFDGDVSNKQEVENGETCANEPTLTAAECTAFYDGNNVTSQWIGVFNAGSLNYYGFDLETEYLPFDWLHLNAAWTFIEASYTSFAFPTVGEIPSEDLSGSTPAQVPKNTITANATVDWPVPSNLGAVSSTLSMYYRASTTFSDVINFCNVQTGFCLNPNSDTAPAYSVYDFSTFWNGVAQSHFDLNVYVKNLANKRYVIYQSPQASLGYAAATFGNPRTFGVGVRYNFQ